MNLILINELVFGSFFTLGQTSLIGIYATFVIAVGRFVRQFLERISQRVLIMSNSR